MSNEVLYRHPEAELLHELGLWQETHGDLQGARGRLEDAIWFVNEAQADADSPLAQALTVQRARISRDLGLTYVRAAVKGVSLSGGVSEIETETFETAELHMRGALTDTRALIYLDQFAPRLRESSEDRDSAVHELHAEHGATLGLMARLTTAEQVVLGDPTVDNYHARRLYGLAHTFLAEGNNGYYRVSNAMNAARDARINWRPTSLWLARAEGSLAWTAAHDPAHLKDAARTNASRMRFLLTRSRAIESVKTAP